MLRSAVIRGKGSVQLGQAVLFDCEAQGGRKVATEAFLLNPPAAPQPTRLVGTVKLWDDERSEGFLQTSSGESASIALADVEGGAALVEGERVSFELLASGAERRAVRVQRVA